jgi:hypothetical protein
MSKEEYYSKIKRFVYKRFNELEVIDRNNGNFLYLGYKNKGYAEIVIDKNSGLVYYYTGFKDKINKMVPLKMRDFEILLDRWVEDTFKIKVINTLWYSNYSWYRI